MTDMDKKYIWLNSVWQKAEEMDGEDSENENHHRWREISKQSNVNLAVNIQTENRFQSGRRGTEQKAMRSGVGTGTHDGDEFRHHRAHSRQERTQSRRTRQSQERASQRIRTGRNITVDLYSSCHFYSTEKATLTITEINNMIQF